MDKYIDYDALMLQVQELARRETDVNKLAKLADTLRSLSQAKINHLRSQNMRDEKEDSEINKSDFEKIQESIIRIYGTKA